MSGQNKKPRELFLYFTPVYNIIIQNWFLDPTERSLAILFSSCPGGVCTLSREILKKYCRCGPYHLERSLRRLEFMKIINVEVGGWKQRNPPVRESNRYTFDYDPYHWRVPKEVQDRIIEETKAMGKEPRSFVNGGFPNQLGMDIVFKEAVPNYAEGRKPRKKKIYVQKHEQPQPTVASLPTVEDQKWLKKIDRVLDDDVSFTFLAAEYYHRIEAIELARKEPAHGFSQHQLTYLERLHYIYTERRQSLTSDDDIALRNGIEIWLRAGRSYFDISNELAKLDQFRKKEIINRTEEET